MPAPLRSSGKAFEARPLGWAGRPGFLLRHGWDPGEGERRGGGPVDRSNGKRTRSGPPPTPYPPRTDWCTLPLPWPLPRPHRPSRAPVRRAAHRPRAASAVPAAPALSPRGCRHCGATLSPQARYCHRCGEPVEAAPAPARPAEADRLAWLVAAALCAVLLGGIVWRWCADQPAPAIPQMANPGRRRRRHHRDVPSGPAPGHQPDVAPGALRSAVQPDHGGGRSRATARRSCGSPRWPSAPTPSSTRWTPTPATTPRCSGSRPETWPARAPWPTPSCGQSPGHLFGYVVRGTAAELAGRHAPPPRGPGATSCQPLRRPRWPPAARSTGTMRR